MFAQIFEITLMNLRNLPARMGSSSVIVVGIAGVVAVLIGVLSMAAGFTAALEGTSMPGRAIVLRDGSNNELASGLSVEAFNILARMEGVKLASDELYVVADVPKKDTGSPANLVIRGMRQAGIDVRPEMRLTEGRLFEPGKGEIIVGVKAASEFAGLSLGDVVEFRESHEPCRPARRMRGADRRVRHRQVHVVETYLR
jgi:putative ABC transport system permease protein